MPLSDETTLNIANSTDARILRIEIAGEALAAKKAEWRSKMMGPI